MKLIPQSYKILHTTPLALIEIAARTSHMSELSKTAEDRERFIRKLLFQKHHTNIIRHSLMSVRLITNRSAMYELIRHDHKDIDEHGVLREFHVSGAATQESTRYVKYDGDMEFILPVWWNDKTREAFDFAIGLDNAEKSYKIMLEGGWRAEQARELLPNALKTEAVISANYEEWRNIFKLRTSKSAHPQIRDLMSNLLRDVKEMVPVIFEDIIPYRKGQE